MKFAQRFTVTILASCLAVPVFAGDLPAEQTSAGGIRFLSGGVGLDESGAIKAAQKDYSLSLLFAQTRRNEFVADVKVSVLDKSGNVLLETVADGPMLMAKLPAGDYTVNAEYQGNAQSRKVHIGTNGVNQLGFVWQSKAKATIE
jgi:hypothetical protein